MLPFINFFCSTEFTLIDYTFMFSAIDCNTDHLPLMNIVNKHLDSQIMDVVNASLDRIPENWDHQRAVYHVSVPVTKLYYPEPFIAAPTFLHFDLWYSHITVYVFWIWFLFSFIIVFFFLTFLSTMRWCNPRLKPRRETRGVSRSKCGDLITAIVPVSWATSIIIHESTDAVDLYDGSGTTHMSLGIRAYQWGWEYYYPRSLDIHHRFNPYQLYTFTAGLISKSFDPRLSSTNRLLGHFLGRPDDNINAAAYNLVLPRHAAKISSFFNAAATGRNIKSEQVAYKNILRFTRHDSADLFSPIFLSTQHMGFSDLFLYDLVAMSPTNVVTKRPHVYASAYSVFNAANALSDIKASSTFVNSLNNREAANLVHSNDFSFLFDWRLKTTAALSIFLNFSQMNLLNISEIYMPIFNNRLIQNFVLKPFSWAHNSFELINKEVKIPYLLPTDAKNFCTPIDFEEFNFDLAAHFNQRTLFPKKHLTRSMDNTMYQGGARSLRLQYPNLVTTINPRYTTSTNILNSHFENIFSNPSFNPGALSAASITNFADLDTLRAAANSFFSDLILCVPFYSSNIWSDMRYYDLGTNQTQTISRLLKGKDENIPEVAAEVGRSSWENFDNLLWRFNASLHFSLAEMRQHFPIHSNFFEAGSKRWSNAPQVEDAYWENNFFNIGGDWWEEFWTIWKEFAPVTKVRSIEHMRYNDLKKKIIRPLLHLRDSNTELQFVLTDQDLIFSTIEDNTKKKKLARSYVNPRFARFYTQKREAFNNQYFPKIAYFNFIKDYRVSKKRQWHFQNFDEGFWTPELAPRAAYASTITNSQASYAVEDTYATWKSFLEIHNSLISNTLSIANPTIKLQNSLSAIESFSMSYEPSGLSSATDTFKNFLSKDIVLELSKNCKIFLSNPSFKYNFFLSFHWPLVNFFDNNYFVIAKKIIEPYACISLFSDNDWTQEFNFFGNYDALYSDFNLRLGTKNRFMQNFANAIVAYESVHKVYRTRYDEGRSNARIKDFSMSYKPLNRLTAPTTDYTKMIKKNINYFFKTNLLKSKNHPLINVYYADQTFTNSYNFDFPFRLAIKSDPARYLWIDWWLSWGVRDIQPASYSRYGLYGLPIFSKHFEFSAPENEMYADTENYLSRLARVRRLTLSAWTGSPFFLGKGNYWFVNRSLVDLIRETKWDVNYLETTYDDLKSFWFQKPVNGITTSMNSFSNFLPATSLAWSPGRASWRSVELMNAYYFYGSKLADVLTKRELLYRDLLCRKEKLIQIPEHYIASPKHALFYDLRAALNNTDNLNQNKDLERILHRNNRLVFDYYTTKLFYNYMGSFLPFPTLTSFLISLMLKQNPEPVPASPFEETIYRNNVSRRSNYKPLRRGASNMVRLHATGAMAMPVHTKIHMFASSRDVIHSWAVPSAGVKIDCIPGYSSHRIIYFMATGIFWGQCMEVCGRYHHWMPIVVHFMKRDLFILWCTHFIFFKAKLNSAEMYDRHQNNFLRVVTHSPESWMSEIR